MLSSNKARCNTRLSKPNLEILLWLKQFKENKFPEKHHALDMALKLFNTLKFQIFSTESDDGQSCEVITWLRSSCSQVFTAAYKKTPIMSLFLNIIAGLRPTKTPPQMSSYGLDLIFQNTFFSKQLFLEVIDKGLWVNWFIADKTSNTFKILLEIRSNHPAVLFKNYVLKTLEILQGNICN